ncbi:MAG: hypothetical protein HY822_23180 [Acidobacteria bacterium]|nr:hypothetical protein [Acidobacteriota bacterium]
MRSIDTSSLPQSRLARLTERQQVSNNSRTSRGVDSPFSSALSRVTGASSRQTLAASDTTRQNLVASPAQTPAAGSLPPRTNPFVPLLPGQVDAGPQAAVVPRAAAQTAPPATAATVAAAPTAATPAAALEVLRAALRKVNIEPSGLNLYYEENVVGYPGGSYVNRLITCELSEGNKESYDVGLMLKNPWLTAFEIGRQTGRRA